MNNELIRLQNIPIPLSRLICNGNLSLIQTSSHQEDKLKNLWETLTHFAGLLAISFFVTLCELLITPPLAQSAEGLANIANNETTIVVTSHCEFSVADTQLADLIKFYQKSAQSLRSALNWVRCEGYNSGPSLLFNYGNVDPLFARESFELQYKALDESFKKPSAIKVIPNAVISLSALGNLERCKDKACAVASNLHELMITF